MFGVNVQDVAAARVLAVASCMIHNRGTLLQFPRAINYGTGYSLWSGLVTRLRETNEGGREATLIDYLDGSRYQVDLDLTKVTKIIEAAHSSALKVNPDQLPQPNSVNVIS